MSAHDWYQVSALFGALAASAILAIAIVRAGVFVVGKVRTRLRRLRLLKALPPARTAFGKRQELKEEISAAEAEMRALEAAAKADEAAEAKRLDEAAKKIEEEEDGLALRDYIDGPNAVFPSAIVANLPFPSRDHANGGACKLVGGTGTANGVGGSVTLTAGTGGLGHGDVQMSAHGATYTFNEPNNATFAHSIRTETSLVGALNTLAKDLDGLKAGVKIPSSGNALYDTDAFAPTQTKGVQLVHLPSLGTIAARPRKEPIWQRRVLPAGWNQTIFFNAYQNGPQDYAGDTNLLGNQGGLPYGHHHFLYTMSVRLDDGTSDGDRRILANHGKIIFDFATTRLMTLPLGMVLDKGVQGHDMTVSGRPIEINAMENFSVRIELTGNRDALSRDVGITVALNGLLLKGTG